MTEFRDKLRVGTGPWAKHLKQLFRGAHGKFKLILWLLQNQDKAKVDSLLDVVALIHGPKCAGLHAYVRLTESLMCRYAGSHGCKILVLGPWAPLSATDDHLQLTVALDDTLPKVGAKKRRFAYYSVGCAHADGLGDGVHFSVEGAAQLLASGLGRVITDFVKLRK